MLSAITAAGMILLMPYQFLSVASAAVYFYAHETQQEPNSAPPLISDETVGSNISDSLSALGSFAFGLYDRTQKVQSSICYYNKNSNRKLQKWPGWGIYELRTPFISVKNNNDILVITSDSPVCFSNISKNKRENVTFGLRQLVKTLKSVVGTKSVLLRGFFPFDIEAGKNWEEDSFIRAISLRLDRLELMWNFYGREVDSAGPLYPGITSFYMPVERSFLTIENVARLRFPAKDTNLSYVKHKLSKNGDLKIYLTGPIAGRSTKTHRPLPSISFQADNMSIPLFYDPNNNYFLQFTNVKKVEFYFRGDPGTYYVEKPGETIDSE